MKIRARTPGEFLGIAALVLFVVYFGAHCFRYPWGWDFGRHCAAVTSLYRDFLHPAHEAMPLPGTLSEVHTPYTVAVAGVGRILGISPYRALQFAAVANLVFYAWAIWFFFRTFSVLRGNWISPIAFLIVSLFLRNRLFHWSSETSFASLRLTQAYPSFFAWSAALTAYALAERFLRRPRLGPLLAAGLLVWTLLLSHGLTATWTIEVLGLRGVWEIWRERGASRRAGALLATIAGAAGLTLLWPYFPIIGASHILRMPEASDFGESPFRDLASLYVVAFPAAIGFFALGRHAFWIAAFGATFLALLAFREAGSEFGNRYAFFQAFFAQAFVAEAIAVAWAVVTRWRDERFGELRIGTFLQVTFSMLGIAAVGLTLAAPAVSEEHRQGRPLLSLSQLAARPSSHDAYYSQLGEVGRRLRPGDLVIMPVDYRGWNISAITGAQVVVSPFAYRTPDFEGRTRDVERFFARGESAEERAIIVEHYRATKVLLTGDLLARETELQAQFGAPIARTDSLVLFETTRARGAGQLTAPGAARLAHQSTTDGRAP